MKRMGKKGLITGWGSIARLRSKQDYGGDTEILSQGHSMAG